VAAALKTLRAAHGDCADCETCEAYSIIARAVWCMADERMRFAMAAEDLADALQLVFIQRWRQQTKMQAAAF